MKDKKIAMAESMKLHEELHPLFVQLFKIENELHEVFYTDFEYPVWEHYGQGSIEHCVSGICGYIHDLNATLIDFDNTLQRIAKDFNES
jgi:hypothetical protein